MSEPPPETEAGPAQPYAPPALEAWPDLPPAEVTRYETTRRRALWLSLSFLTLPFLLFGISFGVGFLSSDPWEGLDRLFIGLGVTLGLTCLLGLTVTGYVARLYFVLGRPWTALLIALLGALSVGLLAFPFVFVAPRRRRLDHDPRQRDFEEEPASAANSS